MSRYAIWNKNSNVIVPTGAVFTAEEWKDRHPVAKVSGMKIVCAGGTINGAFFGVFDQMIEMYSDVIDFDAYETDQQKLDAIEAYENADHSNGESSPEERIAAALEYNNLLNSPVIHDDDPDED